MLRLCFASSRHWHVQGGPPELCAQLPDTALRRFPEPRVAILAICEISELAHHLQLACCSRCELGGQHRAGTLLEPFGGATGCLRKDKLLDAVVPETEQALPQPWTVLLGHLAWIIVLFSWQHFRALLCRPVTVFLDKFCIAQHSDELKAKGILGIAAFLLQSRKLVVLWTPRCFGLVCCIVCLASGFWRLQHKLVGEAFESSRVVEVGPNCFDTKARFPFFRYFSRLWCALALALWVSCAFSLLGLRCFSLRSL